MCEFDLIMQILPLAKWDQTNWSSFLFPEQHVSTRQTDARNKYGLITIVGYILYNAIYYYIFYLKY